MYSKYKQVVKKGTIKIKDTCLGIATSVEILYSRFSVNEVAVSSTSRFKGTNVKGE